MSWENTRKCLKDYTDILTCNRCKGKPMNPRKFSKCGHFFCEVCIGGESECVKCNTPVQPNEVRDDPVIKSLVSCCDELAEVIQMKGLWPKSNRLNHEISLLSTNGKLSKCINKPNSKGETRLHIACISKRQNREEAVKALLDAGANPNTKDYAGWTPLQEVVNYGLTNICKLLLEYGAQPDMPGVKNRRPLHDAVLENRLEEAKLLLKYSARKDVRDDYGNKPIDYCKPDSEMWYILEDGNTPLEVTEATNLNCTLNQSMTQPNEIVMYALNLKDENMSYLQQMAFTHKFKIASVFKPSVTHVIVETNSENIVEPSYDVMLALLRGCWLINTQWIQLKMDLNDIMNGDLEIFEVSGAPNIGVPKRARENAQNLNPRLFKNCNFYFDLQHYDINGKERLKKPELITLVSEGGGTVLKREPNPSDVNESVVPFHVANEPTHSLHRCTHYIIYVPGRHERLRYNMKHIKSLPAVWLIECIERFALVDPMQLGLSSN